MKMVIPALVGQRNTVALNQPEYAPVSVVYGNHPDFPAQTPGNSVIMAFEPTMENRRQIMRGENIYVALLTFGRPQQPIILQVGPKDMADIYQLKLEV